MYLKKLYNYFDLLHNTHTTNHDIILGIKDYLIASNLANTFFPSPNKVKVSFSNL